MLSLPSYFPLVGLLSSPLCAFVQRPYFAGLKDLLEQTNEALRKIIRNAQGDSPRGVRGMIRGVVEKAKTLPVQVWSADSDEKALEDLVKAFDMLMQQASLLTMVRIAFFGRVRFASGWPPAKSHYFTPGVGDWVTAGNFGRFGKQQAKIECLC